MRNGMTCPRRSTLAKASAGTPREFAGRLLERGMLLACQKCLVVLVPTKKYLRCPRCKAKCWVVKNG